jgi:hypothetical protein
MANTVLNPSIIAKTSVRILENELVMGSHVYRGYEEEFDKKINGYDVGDTISVRKPQNFAIRTGATAVMQDVTEGKLSLVVNIQQGVDFNFSSKDLTLKIEQLADRVIRPAMVRLANAVDVSLMSLFTQIPNWVGQPDVGADSTINSFAEFAAGAERLDQMAVPGDMRYAVLAPDSYWALAGSQTALFAPAITTQAYRRGEIGDIGGVGTYMSQNVPTFTGTAAQGDTPTVTNAVATNQVLYDTVKNTEGTPGIWGPATGGAGTGLVTGGWTSGAIVRAGTVFTLGSGATNVLAVNPVTKQVLPYRQMFTVVADVTATGGAATLTITPPIIPLTGTDGNQWATTNIAPAATTVVNVVGDANGNYRQNMMFHRDAFALVMVPMVKPPGAVDVARESYRGTSARVIPYYDGTNDVSNYRLDILYGVKVIDNRMAVRVSGGSGTLGNPAT